MAVIAILFTFIFRLGLDIRGDDVFLVDFAAIQQSLQDLGRLALNFGVGFSLIDIVSHDSELNRDHI